MPTLEELYQERDFEEITKRFEKFLSRYEGIFDPSVSTYRVVALSKKSADMARTLKYLTHNGGAYQVHQMRKSITDRFGKEELSQVVYLSFYEVLNRFDPSRKVPLEKFIYIYFPYIFTAEVTNLAGPRQILNKPNLAEEPEEGEGEDIEIAIADIDYRWVSGETCDEPFSCLTPLERKLLYLIYIEQNTQEEIASEMRYHFSSIKRKKQEVLEKLQKRTEELACQ